MRGGISYIADRFGQTNNKDMTNYDKSKPSRYIIYLDTNKLYGRQAMSQYLPTVGFKWMKKKKTNLGAYTEDSKKGLILEVDLKYLGKLHKKHNDYPLAAEKIRVNKDMLSNYCENIREKYGITIG